MLVLKAFVKNVKIGGLIFLENRAIEEIRKRIFYFTKDAGKQIEKSNVTSHCRSAIAHIWRLIFDKPVTPTASRIAEGFAIYSIGIMLAKLLSMVAQVMIGRLQGPEFYGQLTLVLILANYLALPMINSWGLAYVRLASVGHDANFEKQALKMTMFVALLATLLILVLVITCRNWLARELNVSETVIWLSMVTALASAWWLFAKQVFQAVQDWHQYIAVELLWALLLIAGVVAVFLSHWDSLSAVVMIFVAAHLLGATLAFPRIWRSLFTQTHWPYALEIGHHGVLLLLNGLAGTFAFGLDRLLINCSLGSDNVGIYQAHFLATYGLISSVTAMLINYLFPLFAQDKEGEVKPYLSRLLVYAYPSLFVVSMLSGITLLRLYGYPLSWELLFSLSLFNAVQFHGQLYAWRLAGQGTEMTRRVLAAQLAFLSTNIILLVLLLPKMGMVAGGIALLGASLVFLCLISQWGLSAREESI